LSGKSIDFIVTTPLEKFPDTTACVKYNTTTSIATGYLFPVGETIVECTATDTSGNSATDTFTVTIEFHYTGSGISASKSVKAGSVVPLTWEWRDANGIQDVGDGNQEIRYNKGSCGGPDAVDPGSSNFQKQFDNSWQYNWKTVDPIAGNNLDGGDYCITVKLTTTGDEQTGTVKVRASK